MLAKTRGIVLKTFNYSESSVVAKIYTENFGIKSYLIHGVRKPKAKTKANYLSLLSLLELEVYNRENKEIQHIKEFKLAYVYQTLPYDIRKSSIALFLNELAYNSIKEEESNPALFHFLFNAFQLLDQLQNNYSSFHLHFAVQLTKYLGFGPAESDYLPASVFDLASGKFYTNKLKGLYIINEEESLLLYNASVLNFEDFSSISILRTKKRALLEHLLTYFQLHLPDFRMPLSHEVLEIVLA
ncbi:MAG: DNA repair protein RecO [Bacteroidota bacterium]|jgi:DNA repair protein RecO (recombination protein O)